MYLPRTTVVEPSTGLLDLELKTIWPYRELLYFLVWREVKVRYKQTVLGIAWAVLQPLMTMAIFTVILACSLTCPPTACRIRSSPCGTAAVDLLLGGAEPQ